MKDENPVLKCLSHYMLYKHISENKKQNEGRKLNRR
jgi:hypothetical protein